MLVKFNYYYFNIKIKLVAKIKGVNYMVFDYMHINLKLNRK